MGTKKLILVPMGTKVPKCGPMWEQCIFSQFEIFMHFLGQRQLDHRKITYFKKIIQKNFWCKLLQREPSTVEMLRDLVIFCCRNVIFCCFHADNVVSCSAVVLFCCKLCCFDANCAFFLQVMLFSC